MTLVEHAKKELEILGETDKEFVDCILNVMQAFSSYGHSGGSASAAIPIINDLLQFKALTPLTNNPDEWMEVGEAVWQNRRNSEAFSTDGGKTYYLVSEMTPYYEADQYTPPLAPTVTSPPDPVNAGDTVMPVEVTGDH